MTEPTTDEVVRFSGVPERIVLDDGYVVRRYAEADIPALVATVNANLDHLAPFMPWAQQPASVDSQLAWFREIDPQWDDGTNFVYGVFDPAGDVVGGTGFHVRNGPGVLEIGYWLARDATGRGLMTRVAAALTDAAGAVPGVERVEIHCDEANTASAGIPRRLDYRLLRVDVREPEAPGEVGRQLIWGRDV